MTRNPAYDGSSVEDEEIYPVGIAPLTSCLTTPIVTDPAEDEEEIWTELRQRRGRGWGWCSTRTGDREEMRQVQVEWRSENKEDENNWDPQSNLLPKEYQFPNTTAKEILEQMQYQVREWLGIMDQRWTGRPLGNLEMTSTRIREYPGDVGQAV